MSTAIRFTLPTGCEQIAVEVRLTCYSKKALHILRQRLTRGDRTWNGMMIGEWRVEIFDASARPYSELAFDFIHAQITFGLVPLYLEPKKRGTIASDANWARGKRK